MKNSWSNGSDENAGPRPPPSGRKASLSSGRYFGEISLKTSARPRELSDIFINDSCEADPKGKVALEKFYVAYREWVTESGYSLAQVKSAVKKGISSTRVKCHGEGLVVIGLKLR